MDYDLETVVTKIMDVRAEAFKLRPVNRGLARVSPVEDQDEPVEDQDWVGEQFIRTPRKKPVKKPVSIDEVAAYISERRAKVVPLHEQGMTMTAIAAELGCSHSTIDTDLQALGLK